MITQKKLMVWGVVICVVGFFFGYIAGQGNVAQAPSSTKATEGKLASVSLMLDYGNGMVRTYGDMPVSGAATVLDVTKAFADREKLALKTKDYGDMGKLVEQIGDKTNGNEAKYWQFWVNNVSSRVAADKLPVKAGDVIEWKFLNYK